MNLSTSEQQRLKARYGPLAVVAGASSGIGLELAERLAESGLNLIINARTTTRLERVANDLQTRYGVVVTPVAADLSEETGISQLLEATSNQPVGLFIHSAGFGTSGEFRASNLDEEVNMLRLNTESLLKLTHHFGQRFATQKRGGIILLSSLVAFQGVPYAAHYAATKAYVQTLAEAIALELGSLGVDVLAAAPGPVSSGFGQRANMVMNMSLTPQQVGVPILKALGRQHTVLPGFLTKVLTYSLRTVPRWGKVRIMQQVMSGMTKHQRA
ncbi:SDR family NAD(P)-dependent oxidoreductase [Spirosoma montaniterrae]|uniref:Short-chain dehydrogenase n=1 Tax=Spirosoma montaniterrae TaxID=1178516 RepID=A0A1P9X224_9BACT|nr:SDR family NAD(P)-dependent oxidoreductase [Spirosoma montaniterrae]AQG81669.1 short-chain dehydrogenase [Spirosoma montaniterrae]